MKSDRKIDDLDDTPEARALNAEYCRKLDAAAGQPGFAGELRRAIDAAQIPSHRLAAAVGIDVDQLEDFRTGDAELPFGVVDRLFALLNLKLVPAG